ncbi:MAG TPA: OmpH family outer membrane protein [Flavisolibacter sp.]|jgi:outer membrane protein
MKNGMLALNVVLLLAVGVLFYLHFSSKGNATKVSTTGKQSASSTPAGFKIAYFEMDSLEASFAMVNDVKVELGKKEAAINGELARMEKSYQTKIAQYQQQGASMNQVQSEAAQRDVMQMQQNMQTRKQALDQEYQDFHMRKMKDVKSRIESFLADYNASRGYNYIFANDQGLFYYKDTAYNITADVIKGLNGIYTKKK